MSFVQCLDKGPDEAVFANLIKTAVWRDKGMLIKATGKQVVDKNMVDSVFCCVSVEEVGRLKLHKAIGDVFTNFDYRFVWKKMLLSNTRIIKYKTGGHMKRHSDTQPIKSKVARLILIPPASIYPFTGGCTRLYSTYNYDMHQDPNRWKIAFVPYGMPHEVYRVLSGTRYAIVTDMSISGIDDYTRTWDNYESDEEEEDGFDMVF